MASPRPQNTSSGLSLYANLLKSDGNAAASKPSSAISSAPFLYRQPQGRQILPEQQEADKSQLSSAALRLQPTRRPQLPPQKIRTRIVSQRSVNSIATTKDLHGTHEDFIDPSSTASRTHSKTLADWTAGADEDDMKSVVPDKRQRGGRKRRKKPKAETEVTRNWDDIYDPSQPNVYEDYKSSDERILEIQDWKDRLYAHRVLERPVSVSESEDEEIRVPENTYRFAPPPNFADALPRTHEPSTEEPTGDNHAPKPQPSNPVLLSDDCKESVDKQQQYFAHRQPTEVQQPVQELPMQSDDENSPAKGLVPSASRIPSPPTYSQSSPVGLHQSGVVTRAPVKYDVPPPPLDTLAFGAEATDTWDRDPPKFDQSPDESTDIRSTRPGQRGFAERLMSKYGWTKGSGLGAGGSGITAPLRVQLERQKKKPDSEGGGFTGPGGMGKIIGGKRKGGLDADGSKFGPMSASIVLEGMLNGMDIDHEMQIGEGGLLQEIGEECGEKYGRVERIFIDRTDPAAPAVYVNFTAELSALKAVNALEGRIFNGNIITARFAVAQELA